MKLYTEEQVKEAMETALIPPIYQQDLWGHLTPIELPSDEEIYKNSFEFDIIYWHDGFLAGVDWVIEQIKQQVIP